jgi:23S rRNA pseudouridine1911/1915/1917 synthase
MTTTRAVPAPGPRPTRLTVSAPDHGQSLLAFLSARLDLSRKAAKRLLDSRSVLVDERRVWMARHVLRTGQVVTVQAPVRAPGPDAAVRVLCRADPYLVVDKPAGLPSNGPHSVETLARRQLRMPALLAVHRLDTDTTGCLLLARDRAAFDLAVPLFRARRVSKAYRVIVAGRWRGGDRTVTEPVDGKPAVTHVHPLAAGAAASLLLARLSTGRTHQIRRHLAALGHPVAGDRVYGTRRTARFPALREVPRQMLHAATLVFEHPGNGRTVRAAAPLPADFNAWVRRLGLRSARGGGRAP